MVATDKNKKNLRFNQHYSIYRVEKIYTVDIISESETSNYLS